MNGLDVLQTNDSDIKRSLLRLILGGLLLAIPIGLLIHQGVQYYQTIRLLTITAPQDVTVFRIHPPNERSGRHQIDVFPPDPMIQEFFQSLRDIGLYLPNRDPVDSEEHTWRAEIGTKKYFFHIAFYIPSKKGEIVVGSINQDYSEDISLHFGEFQSQKLFQWYQKYKERWLSPQGRT